MKHATLDTLGGARLLFESLVPPDSLEGAWRAQFVGPAWLRRLAPLGLAVSPLRGWVGKRFDPSQHGENLVLRNGQLQGRVGMRAGLAASRLDQRPVLATRYHDDAPWMLRAVSDEFRVLDARLLLGMMTIDRPLLRGVALPFLLERVDDESAFLRRRD